MWMVTGVNFVGFMDFVIVTVGVRAGWDGGRGAGAGAGAEGCKGIFVLLPHPH